MRSRSADPLTVGSREVYPTQLPEVLFDQRVVGEEALCLRVVVARTGKVVLENKVYHKHGSILTFHILLRKYLVNVQSSHLSYTFCFEGITQD